MHSESFICNWVQLTGLRQDYVLQLHKKGTRNGSKYRFPRLWCDAPRNEAKLIAVLAINNPIKDYERGDAHVSTFYCRRRGAMKFLSLLMSAMAIKRDEDERRHLQARHIAIVSLDQLGSSMRWLRLRVGE